MRARQLVRLWARPNKPSLDRRKLVRNQTYPPKRNMFEQIQRNFWMGRGQGRRLNSNVLRFVASPSELLKER